MTELRTVEDRLRAEYFELVPDMRRTLVALDSDVRHHLLPIIIGLNRYEQVRIVSRLKECESAVDSLRRRQPEDREFDQEKIETYSLSSLRDLVGIRILVFPNQRIAHVHSALLPLLSDWSSDPIPGIDDGDSPIALKYHGRCAALYKTSPDLQGAMGSLTMKQCQQAVLRALRDFETEFERLVGEAREIEDPGPVL
jgi:hypothetical protein